ncbi:MAG: class I SAM-dependent methyltransferase [Dehalococcoidia bacterium]|nr:class I SAM-dependent methyltransferase [Dehalococcoidia bacterium]MDP7511368.1 class I SAM-dependent methyltransferase [Dehalococcoidia bacterium]HJN87322.1 class I SAM-dependent methyltransferase [Dehalococcoidia bacterium]
MGRCLADLGHTDLTAMDMSPAMLEESRAKNLYRALHRMVMGQPLDFPSDTFDAVISVGVFIIGHAPAPSFDELVRVTRAGGHLIFTIRLDVFETGGFDRKLASLEAEGKLRLVEVTGPFAPMPKSKPGSFSQVWAYRAS